MDLFSKMFNSTFASSKGKYNIILPSNPVESIQRVNTPEGVLELHTTQSKGKKHQFIVSYCDYPQHVVDANFPEKMLDGARDGAVSNIHGELLSETLFDFSNTEGREIHIKVNPQVAMRMRLMLIGRRLYQLQAISKPGNIWDKAVSRFFESFQLIDQ